MIFIQISAQELSVSDSLKTAENDLFLQPIDLEKIPAFQLDESAFFQDDFADSLQIMKADSILMDSVKTHILDEAPAIETEIDSYGVNIKRFPITTTEFADSASIAATDTIFLGMTIQPEFKIKMIEDSLRLLLSSQINDSLASVYQNALYKGMAKQRIWLIDSLNRVDKAEKDKLIDSLTNAAYDQEMENRYFQYIISLRKVFEANRSAGGKTSLELTDFLQKEYETYLNSYFPRAHSSQVLAELARFYVLQDQPQKAKLICFKHLVFLPRSPYFASELQLMKKLMPPPASRTDADILLLQLSDIESMSSMHAAEKYLSALVELRNFPHIAFLTAEFLNTHSRYASMLSNGDQIMEKFQVMLKERNLAITAQMMTKRLEFFYPQSPILAEAQFRNILLSRHHFRDYEGAIQQAEDFISRFPAYHKAPEAQLLIGQIYIQNLRQKLKALEAYRKVTERYAGTAQAAEAHFARAEIYLRSSRNYEPALGEYEAIASVYAHFQASAKEALALKAILFEKEGNFEKAIETYDRILEFKPDAEEAATVLIKSAQIAEKKLKDLPQAALRYQKFLQVYPQHAQSKSIKSRLLSIEKKMEKIKKDRN